MSELESDVKQLQDELEKQQVHLREADREKTRAVQELSEQNQRLLDQLSRVSQGWARDRVTALLSSPSGAKEWESSHFHGNKPFCFWSCYTGALLRHAAFKLILHF